MKRTWKTRISTLALALLLAGGMAVPALAFAPVTSVVSVAADGRLAAIEAGMEAQAFPSAQAKAQALAGARYLLYESPYTPLGGQVFPYPNSGGYVGQVSDGTYTVTVKAAGCYAYSKFVSHILYGTFGGRCYPQKPEGGNVTAFQELDVDIIRDFILRCCQAGEHIRLNDTHSMTFWAADAAGFYYTEYPGDSSPKIRLNYVTYAAFTRAVKAEGQAVWVYNANPAENYVSPQDLEEGGAEVKGPTDPEYLDREEMTATGGVLVTQVTKPSGAKASRVGVRFYDSEGNLLKEGEKAVAQVSLSATSFHSTFDITRELGLTLTPGKTYHYQFYAVVDAKTYYGGYRSATTVGVPQFTVYFRSGEDLLETRQVTQGQPYGDLPAYQAAGYHFQGWYTQEVGGVQVTADTIFRGNADQTLYARWTLAGQGHTMLLQIGSPYLYVDGQRQLLDQYGTTPILENNKTLLPIREIIQTMGGTVTWLADTQAVRLEGKGRTLYLQIGNPYMWDGAGSYLLPTAPVLRGNKTMLPVREVVEYFGGTVEWNGEIQTVTIAYRI